MATINIKRERTGNKWFCLEPRLWNIFFNSLLSLEFKSGTKTVGVAEVQLLLTRGKSMIELENLDNIELK